MVVVGSRRVVRRATRWLLLVACVVALPLLALAGGRHDAGGGRSGPSAKPETTAWQASRLPEPTGAKSNGSGYAGPVACTGAGDCVVLGQYTTASGLNEDSIATESAGTWAAAIAPLPTGASQAANLGPYGLACPAPEECLATSLYLTSTSIAADILEQVDGSWSAIALPMPADASLSSPAQIASVACGAPNECVIAGSYTTTAGVSQGLLVTDEEGHFVASEAPLPLDVTSDQAAGLRAVSCFLPTSCVAVGYYVTATGSRQGWLVADDAGVEDSRSAPLPWNAAGGNPLGLMQGISCGTTTTCVVVGQYQSPSGNRLGVIVTRSGEHWSTREMPSPPTPNTNLRPTFYAISCLGAGSCLAVGEYADSSNTAEALALLQRSGQWTAGILLHTRGSKAQVTAVSCASPTTCTAAGRYDTSTGIWGYLTVVSGSAWTQLTAPVPSGANADPYEALGSIACPSGACVATGTYAESGNPQVRLPAVISQS